MVKKWKTIDKSVKNILSTTVLERFKYRYFFGLFFPKLVLILIIFCTILYSVQIHKNKDQKKTRLLTLLMHQSLA